METKTSIQEKRSSLNALSLKAKELRDQLIEQAESPEKAEMYGMMSINEIIVQFFYRSDKDHVFKTFKTWIKGGYAVRKGERAFLLWGRKKQETQKADGEIKNEELEFFPITYVFSNNQVDPIR